MKILIVSNMYPSKEKAYAGIFVKNQYEELQKIISKKDSLEIFFMRRRFTSKFGTILKYLKAFVFFIPYYFKKYDVIHLHFFHPLILLVWIYKKLHPQTKVIVTFHGKDITTQVHKKNMQFFQKIARCVDFTIPVGETLAKMVNEKLQIKTGRILPVGVNNTVFYKEKDIEKIYDFIFIGSFIHRKGIDTVIEAIKQISIDPKISFCFCGSGEYATDLQELLETHNITIKQNQTQNELRGLLNQSKFFLLMSRNEGFPTATIEAMYCGVPVLTSDIPQFKEQVVDGVNGIMSKLEDPSELKENILKIKNMSSNDYLDLCLGASSSFKELSLQSVCEELYSIYKSV